MSINVAVDESLLRELGRYSENRDPAELVHRLLEEDLKRRTAQQRLAAQGGTMTDLQLPERERSTPAGR